MPQVALVHFKGCPHVESARTNLRQAMDIFDRKVGWTEIDLDSATVPDHVRGLPSPTVLVNGRDVSGTSAGAEGRACRMAGAPSVATILEALRRVG